MTGGPARCGPARDTKALGGYSYNSIAPQFSFDKFEAVARAAGAHTTVHVNYGTGTPAEAAAWVRYANDVRGDHVRDWIIGEEVYNDQYTEPDRRVPVTGKQEPAAVNARRYAKNVIAFSKAMKAVDPGIRIGVELLAADPSWLAGHSPVSARLRYFNSWSKDVAATPGLTGAVDFAPAVGNLRKILGASTRAGHHVKIIAGEVNSAPTAAPYSATQSNAAYLADTELTLLEHGASQVHWFGLYSGLEQGSPTADLGLLSTGNCQESCEAPAGTPLPTYYSQQLVSTVARPGGLLVAGSATGAVSAHAVRQRDGRLAVLLVNRGTAAVTVRLAVSGYHATGTAVIQQATGTGIRHTHGRPAAPLSLPGYSVTVVQLHR
jgi:alpha-N-arabinofuranosidase